MRVRRFESAREFLGEAGAWLSSREAENNLILGLATDLAEGEEGGGSNWGAADQAPWYVTVRGKAGLVGCAIRTPPHPVLLSRIEPALAKGLAAEVHGLDPGIGGIMAADEEGEAFSRSWCSITGGDWAVGMGNILHDLTELIPPARPAPGSLRTPSEAEGALVHSWMGAFIHETHLPSSEDPGRVVRRLGPDLLLWDDRGPRSMVAITGRTPGSVRIGYVYTPPAERGRGYATAAVAQLTADCLARGFSHCVLYTDEENPTSNAIYRRLGYRPMTTMRYFQLMP